MDINELDDETVEQQGVLSLEELANILEAVLMVSSQPLSIEKLKTSVFHDVDIPSAFIKQAIDQLNERYVGTSVEVSHVASGYRIQAKAAYSNWVGRLFEEKPARYSRAMLETLALIAYRQPITRGEIEDVRGVSVSSHIMRSLVEREWVRVVGYKDVPGRPAMYATTKQFLDYFNLQNISELPDLPDQSALEELMQVPDDESDPLDASVPDVMMEDQITSETSAQTKAFLDDELSKLDAINEAFESALDDAVDQPGSTEIETTENDSIETESSIESGERIETRVPKHAEAMTDAEIEADIEKRLAEQASRLAD